MGGKIKVVGTQRGNFRILLQFPMPICLSLLELERNWGIDFRTFLQLHFGIPIELGVYSWLDSKRIEETNSECFIYKRKEKQETRR
jgi:hypothetical protein